jgi:hypothetical protein
MSPMAIRSSCVVAAVISAAFTGGVAAADREAADAARVDWAAGQIIAGGTGLADRHAPSPAVALGTSQRGAVEAAKRRIAARLGSLALAAGGTLAARLADAAVKARVDAAVDAAITLTAEPETDGSWHVTVAVPLEAIRIALDGPRSLPADGDTGPPIVVVEGAAAKPALGWTVGGAPCATLWVKDVPEWARGAPRAKARSASRGAIALDAATGGPATLYIVVAR